MDLIKQFLLKFYKCVTIKTNHSEMQMPIWFYLKNFDFHIF